MNSSLKLKILEQSIAMVKYLAAEGKAIPNISEKLLDLDLKTSDQVKISNEQALNLHKQLSKKVAPAKPKTILLLYQESEKKKWFSFLGQVSLVRRLMVTTIFSLIIFVLISLSSFVDGESLSKGVLNNHGINLLFNLFFIISAAALGGCFSNLFQANKFITEGTFDPKYESSYWIRILLGLIAGLMLAVIIPATGNVNLGEGKGLHLTIPLLAMLGGFSAALVYRILTRIVWAVESLFVGKQDDASQQKILNMQTLHEQEQMIEQQNTFQDLMKIKAEIGSEKGNEKVVKLIDETMNKIMPKE